MFNRKYIFKWWVFHCHVSFRGGSLGVCSKRCVETWHPSDKAATLLSSKAASASHWRASSLLRSLSSWRTNHWKIRNEKTRLGLREFWDLSKAKHMQQHQLFACTCRMVARNSSISELSLSVDSRLVKTWGGHLFGRSWKVTRIFAHVWGTKRPYL